MALEAFMKIKGIEDECIVKGHEKELELYSWQWGANQSSTCGQIGQSRGKADAGSFNFTHKYSKASPVLAQKLAKGEHFDEVTVSCRQAANDQQDFLVITLKGALVSNIAPSASAGGDVIESVTLVYNEVQFEYKPKDKDGKMGGSVKMGWNVATQVVT